jgi:peroxiredoxin
MRHLQQAYQDHRDEGLVVVGLNCADEPAIALEFLAENEATFPNILDDSAEALRTCFTHYQTLAGTSAVPLSYILDRDGRIAAGWYGRHEASKVRRVLAKLGLR